MSQASGLGVTRPLLVLANGFSSTAKKKSGAVPRPPSACGRTLSQQLQGHRLISSCDSFEESVTAVHLLREARAHHGDGVNAHAAGHGRGTLLVVRVHCCCDYTLQAARALACRALLFLEVCADNSDGWTGTQLQVTLSSCIMAPLKRPRTCSCSMWVTMQFAEGMQRDNFLKLVPKARKQGAVDIHNARSGQVGAHSVCTDE